jgi:hypothetical protein
VENTSEMRNKIRCLIVLVVKEAHLDQYSDDLIEKRLYDYRL